MIMVASGRGQRHILNIDGWSETERQAVALTYEASGFDVATTEHRA